MTRFLLPWLVVTEEQSFSRVFNNRLVISVISQAYWMVLLMVSWYMNTYIHIYFIYIYIHTHIVCSTLKHQLNTDILDENDTCISNAVSVSSRKCSI